MGNLAEDTAVEGADGRYTATFGSDWNIWGPNGGYVAAVALRAAGVHSEFPRPASILCHYLGVAAFEPVDIEVVSLRKAKRAESVRVSIRQGGNPIAEAMVWCIADEMAGLVHDAATTPDVPPPSQLKSMRQHLEENGVEQPQSFIFWDNFDDRLPAWMPWEEWANREVLEPHVNRWLRFKPQATFDDPFVDACRSVILIDTFQWPAAVGAHRPDSLTYVAPSLDLAVSLHDLDPSSEWLLVDAVSPIARDGLVGGQASVWSESGKLLASGGQQMLCRPAPPQPPR
ncbi:MAG TPA: thioesterase family protein [Acidimicrobiales bacterium]